MKRVLLDCDGVLSDFIGATIELVNQTLGTSHRATDVKRFDFVAELGLTKEQGSAVKRAIGDCLGFAENLAVLPGAREGVARLREVAEVFIVTSPWNSNATWTHDREWWLKKNFDIPHSHVIHTSAKYVCAGDVFVDDKTSALVKWREAHPLGHAVQWMTPHNHLEDWQGFATDNWSGIINLVNGDPWGLTR